MNFGAISKANISVLSYEFPVSSNHTRELSLYYGDSLRKNKYPSKNSVAMWFIIPGKVRTNIWSDYIPTSEKYCLLRCCGVYLSDFAVHLGLAQRCHGTIFSSQLCSFRLCVNTMESAVRKSCRHILVWVKKRKAKSERVQFWIIKKISFKRFI